MVGVSKIGLWIPACINITLHMPSPEFNTLPKTNSGMKIAHQNTTLDIQKYD